MYRQLAAAAAAVSVTVSWGARGASRGQGYRDETVELQCHFKLDRSDSAWPGQAQAAATVTPLPTAASCGVPGLAS